MIDWSQIDSMSDAEIDFSQQIASPASQRSEPALKRDLASFSLLGSSNLSKNLLSPPVPSQKQKPKPSNQGGSSFVSSVRPTNNQQTNKSKLLDDDGEAKKNDQLKNKIAITPTFLPSDEDCNPFDSSDDTNQQTDSDSDANSDSPSESRLMAPVSPPQVNPSEDSSFSVSPQKEDVIDLLSKETENDEADEPSQPLMSVSDLRDVSVASMANTLESSPESPRKRPIFRSRFYMETPIQTVKDDQEPIDETVEDELPEDPFESPREHEEYAEDPALSSEGGIDTDEKSGEDFEEDFEEEDEENSEDFEEDFEDDFEDGDLEEVSNGHGNEEEECKESEEEEEECEDSEEGMEESSSEDTEDRQSESPDSEGSVQTNFSEDFESESDSEKSQKQRRKRGKKERKRKKARQKQSQNWNNGWMGNPYPFFQPRFPMQIPTQFGAMMPGPTFQNPPTLRTSFRPTSITSKQFYASKLDEIQTMVDTLKTLKEGSFVQKRTAKSFRYTTLEETKRYIKKHRPPTLTMEEALKIVDAEEGDN